MTINLKALAMLSENAEAVAKAELKLIRAFVAEGMVDRDAREEARSLVMFGASLEDMESEGSECPLCGRGGYEG